MRKPKSLSLLRKPMTDTPTTKPAGLPSTPEACRAEQGRVLQRLHGTTPGTWQAISGGYIIAKAQSGNEWVCDGGFDSEADLSLAAASPNTHQAYAGLLAEHATLLEQQAALAEMQGLLREMEWGGKQEGQPLGSMWHHTPGPLVPACPLCGGIKPGSSDDFVEKAYGHRPECRLGTFLHSTTQEDPL